MNFDISENLKEDLNVFNKMDDSDNPSEEATRYSSILVSKMFHKRRKQFGRSLQQILIQVSHDEIVRSVLQDRSTSQFAFARIEEIIKNILTDDREQFIDVLLQKLQNFEALYLKDHTQNIRSLSDRILSVTNEQNADEISNIRKIQTLVEQVRALQSEVIKLRGISTDNLVDVEDIKRGDPYHDLNFDTTKHSNYHIHANCDLSDFELKLKLIDTDAKAAKEMLTVMCQKMSQIFQIVKEKSLANMIIYRSRIELLQQDLERSKSKIIDLQRHFDKSVIPSLYEKQKESKSRHQKMLQQYASEISELKSKLYNANNQIQKLSSERVTMQNNLNEIQQQHDDDESHIESLTKENESKKQTIQQQSDEIRSLTKQLDELKQTVNQNSSIIRISQEEIAKLKQTGYEKDKEISKISTELKNANAQIPRLKDEADLVTRQLDEMKQQKDLIEQKLDLSNQRNKNLDQQVNEMQPKLDQATSELISVKEVLKKLTDENDTKSRQILQKTRELDDFNEKVAALKTDLLRSQNVVQQQEAKISDLQSEKKNIQVTFEELDDKFKKLNQNNDKLRKELMEEQMNASRQTAKIESLTDNQNQLQNEIENLTKKNSKIESDNRKLKEEISNTEEENKRLSDVKQQLQQKVTKSSDDIEKLNKKISDISKQLNEVTTRAEEENQTAKEQRKQNISLKSKVDELEAMNHQLQLAKEKNEKLLAQNEQSIQNLESKVESLNNNKNNLTEKLQHQIDKNNQFDGRLNSLQDENKEMQNLLNSIQRSLPGKSIKEIPKEIARITKLAKLANEVSNSLGLKPDDDILEHIAELKQQEEFAKKVSSILPNKSADQLFNHIQKLKAENDKLKNEQQKIASLIPNDASVDISHQIEEIIQKQNKLNDELTKAADFISTLLSIFTGSTANQTRLAFPLKKSIETKLIDLVTRLKNRADNDRLQINQTLEKAKSYGYEGENIIEAADFIVARESENERQQTFSMIDRELGDVRNFSSSEKQSYIQKNEELKQKIKILRENISQQNEKLRETEDSMSNRIVILEKENRKLRDELENEKKIREELTRLNSGLSADTDLIRSKLSPKELNSFDFAENRTTNIEHDGNTIRRKQKTTKVTKVTNNYTFNHQSDFP